MATQQIKVIPRTVFRNLLNFARAVLEGKRGSGPLNLEVAELRGQPGRETFRPRDPGWQHRGSPWVSGASGSGDRGLLSTLRCRLEKQLLEFSGWGGCWVHLELEWCMGEQGQQSVGGMRGFHFCLVWFWTCRMLDCDLFLTHVCPALSCLNARETSCFSNKKLGILHSVIFVVKREEVCFIVQCVTSLNYPWYRDVGCRPRESVSCDNFH